MDHQNADLQSLSCMFFVCLAFSMPHWIVVVAAAAAAAIVVVRTLRLQCKMYGSRKKLELSRALEPHANAVHLE